MHRLGPFHAVTSSRGEFIHHRLANRILCSARCTPTSSQCIILEPERILGAKSCKSARALRTALVSDHCEWAHNRIYPLSLVAVINWCPSLMRVF